MIDLVQSPEGERLYRLCRTPSKHHHLFCRVCGKVEEVAELAELVDLTEKIRHMSGFGEIDYSFELTGICPRCT